MKKTTAHHKEIALNKFKKKKKEYLKSRQRSMTHYIHGKNKIESRLFTGNNTRQDSEVYLHTERNYQLIIR